jgi:phosphate transport system substrate-binding protein
VSFKRSICAMCVLGTALFAVPAAASAKPTITMSGSTSIFPLASDLARGYLHAHPRSVTFKLLQGGSDVGIADVAHGRVTIGNSSRDPKPGDPGGLVFKRIARDAVCIATNKSNPLPNLSQSQIQAIFTGRVRNWSDIPGSRATGSIDLKVRTAASGTQDAFQNIFLGQNLRVAGSASTYSSNGLLQQSVKNDPKAIGYVSFDFAAGLHTIPYAGVACNLRNAKSGQYGGTRNFWMVTRQKAKGAAAKFLKYILSAGAQRSIVAKHWVPIR